MLNVIGFLATTTINIQNSHAKLQIKDQSLLIGNNNSTVGKTIPINENNMASTMIPDAYFLQHFP